MKSFRTLDLAIQFHDDVNQLKISGHLRDQILRASSSIALNLSEGNAKFSVKEKKRFFQMAYSSQKECQTIFIGKSKIQEQGIHGDFLDLSHGFLACICN